MTDVIEEKLLSLADSEYRDFQAKLMPTVDKNTIIGVRTPLLRKYAKELSKLDGIEEFLHTLPHKYYDEYNLHGFIISEIKDFDSAVKRLEEYLPFVDNWATCDILSPKAFKKNRAALKPQIEKWLKSDKPFTVRFGIEMIMSHFLDEDFDKTYLDRVAKIKSDEYYVKMMVAWYFATALAKQWESTLPVIESGKLDTWTHNKTIQKAVESYRITDSQKEYLRTLKKAK